MLYLDSVYRDDSKCNLYKITISGDSSYNVVDFVFYDSDKDSYERVLGNYISSYLIRNIQNIVGIDAVNDYIIDAFVIDKYLRYVLSGLIWKKVDLLFLLHSFEDFSYYFYSLSHETLSVTSHDLEISRNYLIYDYNDFQTKLLKWQFMTGIKLDLKLNE